MDRPRRFQPLPTTVGTTSYRSRLEAKWAVFWRSLGILAEYEAGGFDLGDAIAYRPDFRIPSWETWVEIKPHGVDLAVAEVRCQALARSSGWRVLLIVGEPSDRGYSVTAYGDFNDQRFLIEGGHFAECPRCEGLGVVSDWGWQEFGPHPCRDRSSIPFHDPVHAPRLFEAYAQAGLERFHGGRAGPVA